MLNANTKKKNNKTNKMRRRRFQTFLIFSVMVLVIICMHIISCITKETEMSKDIQKDIRPTVFGSEISKEEIMRTQEWIRETSLKNTSNKDTITSSELEANTDQYDMHYAKKYIITEYEYKLLCMVTFAEASPKRDNRNELTSIASVILKRMDEPGERFPDNIADIVFQPGEFNSTRDETVYWFKEANNEVELYFEDVNELTKEAVQDALE